jgi:hypothetical protein
MIFQKASCPAEWYITLLAFESGLFSPFQKQLSFSFIYREHTL